MTEQTESSGWARFWNRGTWWKAVVLAAGYYVAYQLAGLAMGPLERFAGSTAGPTYVLINFVLPIAAGGLILIVFGRSVGWLRTVFAEQPIDGRWWMWIAVVVVVGFNLLRLASIDYAGAGFGYVAMWLVAGLCIGFAEETLTRGYVIAILRKAGHSEIVVAVVSSAIFAGLHSGNLLTGQSTFATAIQLLYTFGFGICMYLTLRVTRRLIWPILAHASTDPTIYLQSVHHLNGPIATIASLGNFPVIVVGLGLIACIRGRVPTADGTSLNWVRREGIEPPTR